MSAYKVEICGVNTSKLPTLTNAEKDKLLREIKAGNNEARERFIKGNLRLVLSIIHRFSNSNENVDDLFQIGCIGLIKAIDTYYLDKKVRLATYASRCIENEILMVLRSNKKHSKNVSLSDTIAIDKDGSEIELIEVIPSQEENVVDTMEKNRLLNELNKYLNILDEREYTIISLRYGLDSNEELTQNEIASMYDISRSYVSRIEKRALSKLLTEFKKNKAI